MKEKAWQIPLCKPDVPPALLRAGYPPLLAALLALRGAKTREEAEALFFGGLETLHNPLLMKGMPAAAARLQRAILHREKVAVYGDYDVDGITSTCLLTDYLQGKGLDCLSYIPDRDTEGYGLNKAAIDLLHSQGVRLLISVDCGITARDECAYAGSLGMDVVITDHHECRDTALPGACAVVDPKQDGESYPNRYLAGVGVAMKLACACEGDSKSILERYADLVAVGTVADVMPLVGENRTLVRYGLKKLIEAPCPGMAAMIREAGIDPNRLNAVAVGYTLAPRLNAAGRLGCSELAKQLLLTDDPAEAARLAAELCELNRQRQAIELQIWQEASAMLAGSVPDGPIVLASEHWHQGVIGIAASRLAEQYARPAIMICLNGESGKGSCRSYGSFNLFEALSACSDTLLGFGGHALAAGLTVETARLDAFRAALSAYYQAHKPESPPALACDMLITDPALLSLDNVRALDQLEPYGNQNPKPLLCMSGAVLEALSPVGGGKHLRLRVRLRESCFEGIFFSCTSKELGLGEGDCVDLVFTPQINDYRGRQSVQLVVGAMRAHRPEALCRAILDGDERCLWAAADFCPERADFVRAWRTVEKLEAGLAQSAAGIVAQSPPEMPPERFCLCLAAFAQTGLLRAEASGLYGARINETSGKVDLEATKLMRQLRSESGRE